eukprot:3256397-Pleurochrysis_carterae.AAC.1
MVAMTRRMLFLIFAALVSRHKMHKHQAQLQKIQDDYALRCERRRRAAVAHMQLILLMATTATRANDFYAQCDGSTKRRKVSRAFAGWRGSTLAGYLYGGDKS